MTLEVGVPIMFQLFCFVFQKCVFTKTGGQKSVKYKKNLWKKINVRFIFEKTSKHTKNHMISHDNPWYPMMTPEDPWWPMMTHDDPWIPLLKTPDITWYHLITPEFDFFFEIPIWNLDMCSFVENMRCVCVCVCCVFVFFVEFYICLKTEWFFKKMCGSRSQISNGTNFRWNTTQKKIICTIASLI